MNVYLMSVQLCGTGMHQINYDCTHMLPETTNHGKGTLHTTYIIVQVIHIL